MSRTCSTRVRIDSVFWPDGPAAVVPGATHPSLPGRVLVDANVEDPLHEIVWSPPPGHLLLATEAGAAASSSSAATSGAAKSMGVSGRVSLWAHEFYSKSKCARRGSGGSKRHQSDIREWYCTNCGRRSLSDWLARLHYDQSSGKPKQAGTGSSAKRHRQAASESDESADSSSSDSDSESGSVFESDTGGESDSSSRSDAAAARLKGVDRHNSSAQAAHSQFAAARDARHRFSAAVNLPSAVEGVGSTISHGMLDPMRDGCMLVDCSRIRELLLQQALASSDLGSSAGRGSLLAHEDELPETGKHKAVVSRSASLPVLTGMDGLQYKLIAAPPPSDARRTNATAALLADPPPCHLLSVPFRLLSVADATIEADVYSAGVSGADKSKKRAGKDKAHDAAASGPSDIRSTSRQWWCLLCGVCNVRDDKARRHFAIRHSADRSASGGTGAASVKPSDAPTRGRDSSSGKRLDAESARVSGRELDDDDDGSFGSDSESGPVSDRDSESESDSGSESDLEPEARAAGAHRAKAPRVPLPVSKDGSSALSHANLCPGRPDRVLVDMGRIAAEIASTGSSSSSSSSGIMMFSSAGASGYRFYYTAPPHHLLLAKFELEVRRSGSSSNTGSSSSNASAAAAPMQQVRIPLLDPADTGDSKNREWLCELCGKVTKSDGNAKKHAQRFCPLAAGADADTHDVDHGAAAVAAPSRSRDDSDSEGARQFKRLNNSGRGKGKATAARESQLGASGKSRSSAAAASADGYGSSVSVIELDDASGGSHGSEGKAVAAAKSSQQPLGHGANATTMLPSSSTAPASGGGGQTMEFEGRRWLLISSADAGEALVLPNMRSRMGSGMMLLVPYKVISRSSSSSSETAAAGSSSSSAAVPAPPIAEAGECLPRWGSSRVRRCKERTWWCCRCACFLKGDDHAIRHRDTRKHKLNCNAGRHGSDRGPQAAAAVESEADEDEEGSAGAGAGACAGSGGGGRANGEADSDEHHDDDALLDAVEEDGRRAELP